MRFQLLWIILLPVILISCEEEQPVVPPPPDLMAEDLYLEVFTEMEMLKVYQTQGTAYEVVDSLYDAILLKYDIDGINFVESHRYYQAQPIEHTARVDTVRARLQRELDRITEVERTKRRAQLAADSLANK